MIRCSLIVCFLALITAPVDAQESTPLGALKLDLNRLKTWETKS